MHFLVEYGHCDTNNGIDHSNCFCLKGITVSQFTKHICLHLSIVLLLCIMFNANPTSITIVFDGYNYIDLPSYNNNSHYFQLHLNTSIIYVLILTLMNYVAYLFNHNYAFVMHCPFKFCLIWPPINHIHKSVNGSVVAKRMFLYYCVMDIYIYYYYYCFVIMYNIMNYNVMTINVKKDIISINDFLTRYVIANNFNSLTHVFELIKKILQLHTYYKIKYICRVNLSYTCIYLKLVVTLELSKICYLCHVLIFIFVMYWLISSTHVIIAHKLVQYLHRDTYLTLPTCATFYIMFIHRWILTYPVQWRI